MDQADNLVSATEPKANFNRQLDTMQEPDSSLLSSYDVGEQP